MEVDEDLARRLARVRLVALDVDGVLTDGRVSYAGDEEFQRFCARDGLGIRRLREAGIEVAWISGRGCRATERRAAELGVVELHLGVADKERVLAKLQERLGIEPVTTLAMGDDLPDLALARRAGLFAAPADAELTVRQRAALVTTRRGGEGAVRELAECVLTARAAHPPRATPRGTTTA